MKIYVFDERILVEFESCSGFNHFPRWDGGTVREAINVLNFLGVKSDV